MNDRKKVLIVDDDDDFATAVTALLEHAGHSVGRASDGTAGLAMAKSMRPDIILLDVMMTERTEGFFTLQAMRRVPELARTPIVIVSSVYTEFPQFRVDPRAGWLPADMFLAKPIDPQTLLSEVERLTTARESGRAGVSR
jgi:CheY-like chemotaxis protein